MKMRVDQLKRHLQDGLQPIYFISGDEPLQVMEATDAVRQAARKQGFTEREVMDVDKQFDWNQLSDSANSLSLFAEQRILELRLPTGKPGKVGGQALQDYAARPADDAILIISAGKLDGSSKNTKWFKSLDKAGVVLQCWPLSSAELPRWIGQRMQQKGLTADADAIALLSEKVEGNMLAAAQEVDKLVLLYGQTHIDVAQLGAAVSDSSRYSIYDLVDSALAGELSRTSHIVGSLKNEGVEATLALWAITREVRLVASIAEADSSADAAMAKLRVWDSRKTLLRKALSRHPANRWKMLLKRCARIDKVIKGVEAGRPWDELLTVSTQIARTS